MDPKGAFAAALHFILQKDVEGGYVNDPRDPGGPTNHGITERVYDEWRLEHKQPLLDVREIAMEEVSAIYHDSYWQPAHLDEVVNLGFPRLAIAIFDFAINGGVGHAIKLLQEVLGFALCQRDGILGPATLRAISQGYNKTGHSEKEILSLYLTARSDYYKSLKTFPIYGRGWLARVNKLSTYLLSPCLNP